VPIGAIIAAQRRRWRRWETSESGSSRSSEWPHPRVETFVLAFPVWLIASYLYVRSVVLVSDFLLLSYPNANSIDTIVYSSGVIIYLPTVLAFLYLFQLIALYFYGMIAVYLLCIAILFSALYITDTAFNIATGHDAPPPFTVCPECPPGNFQIIDFVPQMFLPFKWFFHWFDTYMGISNRLTYLYLFFPLVVMTIVAVVVAFVFLE